MNRQFYARGKILLTSEFMILHGARALAVPLNVGQHLHVIDKKVVGQFHWIARYNSEIWFETILSLDDLGIIKTSSGQQSENLKRMLRSLVEIKPEFMKYLHAGDVITNLEFDPRFGFGSSSTLTSLLAQWAGIDSMQLHFRISRGSGYDVACATSEGPILYQVLNEMPVVQSVDFRPGFMDKMWLVYLGKKQESGKSVAAFLNNYQPNPDDVAYFSSLTGKFLKAASPNDLGSLIMEHENKLSEILNIPALKSVQFNDLEGYVKSLGAWGGDFALLVTEWDRERLSSYLTGKGMTPWFNYSELAI
ncbi:MAG: GYDIA family GHMP kinase [Bacteroidales bacterium]